MITKYFIFILIIIFILFIILKYNTENEVVYVKSTIDNKKYLVRDLPDKQVCANMLAKIMQNIYKLSDHLYNNRNNNKYKEHKDHIEQLHSRIRNCIVSENGSNAVYTSYSINKGEQIVFCLRSRDDMDKLHDINLVMYVALHEISHIACPEYDHTPLFNKIFAFIANVAVDIGVYSKIDFEKNNTEYCGMILNQSII
jgi:hypothetical protein